MIEKLKLKKLNPITKMLVFWNVEIHFENVDAKLGSIWFCSVSISNPVIITENTIVDIDYHFFSF